MSQSLSPARLDLRPTTARGSLAGGLIVAAVLHLAIIAATLFTWQHRLEIADETPSVVPVDLVTIADKTNIMPTVARDVKPVPADEVKPPSDTPAPTPTPPPAAEAAPAPPKPAELKPAPAPKPAVKPDAKPVPPDEKKKPKDSVNSLLDSILGSKPATPQRARVDDNTRQGIGAMNAATMDLIDALKSQIRQCWTSPPIGAAQARHYRPRFRLFLNPDGSVARPPQLAADLAAQEASDPMLRIWDESARRAIVTCQNYKLPANKYDIWRDITVDFDLSDKF